MEEDKDWNIHMPYKYKLLQLFKMVSWKYVSKSLNFSISFDSNSTSTNLSERENLHRCTEMYHIAGLLVTVEGKKKQMSNKINLVK